MDDLDQSEIQISESSQDVDAYINYYGLTGDPFDSQKGLFFTTAQLEKSLRLFNYLARFSRKLVVVTGVTEAGKTSLLENFVNGQDESGIVCSFAALASDSPAQVLLEMAEQLNVPDLVGGESPEQLSQAIREYSLECLDHDNHCIVVIDDAELFEQPVLEQLYRLMVNEPGQRCGISLLLCGQPELISNVLQVVPADIAEKAVFHQPIIPFSCEEVSKYLHLHFIENAGQSKAPFSQNEFKTIFEQSEGLPGRINETAKQVLLAGMGGLLVGDEPANKKSKGFTFVVAGLLVAAGVGFLWWQSGNKQPEAVEIAAQSLVGQIERVAEASQDENAKLPLEQIFVEPAPEVEVAALIEESGIEEGDTKKVEAAEASVGKSDSNEIQSPPLEAAKVAPLVEVMPQPNMDEVKERAVATDALPEAAVEAALPVEAIPQSKTTSVAPEVPTSRLLQDAARILAFKPTDFTMQLLGSHKEESIKKILDKLPGDSQPMYFQKTHKGAPWYVLIYGDYPDRAAANAATTTLPRVLRSFKPWVRGVSGIQDTIKANQ
jgi:DamX protein